MGLRASRVVFWRARVGFGEARGAGFRGLRARDAGFRGLRARDAGFRGRRAKRTGLWAQPQAQRRCRGADLWLLRGAARDLSLKGPRRPVVFDVRSSVGPWLWALTGRPCSVQLCRA